MNVRKWIRFTDERGIDIMIVGIGMNGHIGFNEPGTSFTTLSHVTELDEITKSVGQKYFDEPVELGKGSPSVLGIYEYKKSFFNGEWIKESRSDKKNN